MVKYTITISSCLEVAVVALFYQAKKKARNTPCGQRKLTGRF